MRVALVHDWLTGMRGGERCLERIAARFPEADLYTLIHVPGATSSRIESLRIHASALSRLPGVARHYRKLLPLFPWAIERFDLGEYDLVISSSHSVAKGVRTGPEQAHLCYCFTPMRYVWDQAEAYRGRGVARILSAPAAAWLRRFDRRTSTPERVTRFTAISTCVAERIRRHYGRSAEVVFPPVELDRFPVNATSERDDSYLLVGAFVPYKQEALAIEAFRRPALAGHRLVVVGDGPGRARLAATAPPNVEFVGRVSDTELAQRMARARALLYPQVEDFGITAVEAQACGTPVIAFAQGGALDTVVGDPTAVAADDAAATGVFFRRAEPDALVAAILDLEGRLSEFDPLRIRAWAERFSPERFEQGLAREIEATLRAVGGRPRA